MSESEKTSANSANETLGWSQPPAERDLTGVRMGDFQVERLLGKGGMGEVYLARQLSLNRPVALKVLRPDLLTKQNYLSRFEAEATAVAKLNHPNIVHIYTLGETEGVRFIAMEYVQGTNLREYIKKKGALDYPVALSIMKQAAVAVGAAGEIGLIHRDIKPENLLLTRKGQVKVADFGLCRDLDAERMNLTQTGVTMGTPAYMSPEQAQGLALDHRSDLYSLGVTFYYMLAGVTPFRAETPIAMALKHVKDVPVSLAVHRPDISPALDRLVLKLMAKSPADRYQSAAELLRDLSKVREAISAPSGTQPFLPDVPGPSATYASIADAQANGATPSATGLQTAFLSPDAVTSKFGSKAKASLVVMGLLLGSLAGWLNRPQDLLAALAPGSDPKLTPGLWIAPHWKDVNKEDSAEDQFHYAQVRAPRETLDAAWLAVPGHFPALRDWASRAYTQFARLLLLRGDAERLKVFAEEIDRWEGAQTHEKELANVIRAGVKALTGDLDGVLNDFDVNRIDTAKLTDPALVELCLQVTDLSERIASRPGASSNIVLAKPNLKVIHNKLMEKLFITGLRDPLFNRPGPG